MKKARRLALMWFATMATGPTAVAAQEVPSDPLGPLVAMLPIRHDRYRVCPSTVDTNGVIYRGRVFVCEGDRPAYGLIADSLGVVRVLSYGSGISAPLRSRAAIDSLVAKLTHIYGQPRRCGRVDWQWRIPNGEINVQFLRFNNPDGEPPDWTLGVLAQWGVPRYSRGEGWSRCRG